MPMARLAVRWDEVACNGFPTSGKSASWLLSVPLREGGYPGDSSRYEALLQGQHITTVGEGDRVRLRPRCVSGNRHASASVEQLVRASRHVGYREHLGGEQSPWKDRGLWHQR
jgi:hypothetical protein